jgi:hypothetical protein
MLQIPFNKLVNPLAFPLLIIALRPKSVTKNKDYRAENSLPIIFPYQYAWAEIDLRFFTVLPRPAGGGQYQWTTTKTADRLLGALDRFY